MSSVYRAHDPNLRRKVAIKIIHQNLSANKEFVQRFEHEAAVIAQLRHPNIVQVHDFNHEGDVYFMVMEYVPGETLAKRLEALKAAGTRMPLNDTTRILNTICSAVDYAHQHRMIHRDLKPSNVMLNLLAEPVLMDFGIAQIVGGDSNTAAGATIGTAAYLSPEQARGNQADHRADIYSLGIMMYEMLSGELPYHGDSTHQIMHKHIKDPLPDIQSIESNTPTSLVTILDRALAKNPDNRFQTAHDMATALKTAALQMPVSPTETLAARHLDRLTTMWQQARDLYDEREFARCLDKLDELHRADADYQEQKAKQLREQAIQQLVERIKRNLADGDYSDGLTAVQFLRARQISAPALEALEAQARTGLDTLALQSRLNQLYDEALACLDNREYQAALAKWEAIQQLQGELPFADKLAVEKRATEGICANLYNQAIAALAKGNPNQALAFWAQISATDSNFPDTQAVLQSAEEMIRKQNRKSGRRPLLLMVGALGLVLVVLLVAEFLEIWSGNSGQTAVSATAIPVLAAVSTETATATLSPTATNTPLPTATATNTAVPTSTPSPTAQLTPSATPLPEDMALTTENAAIFALPSAESSEVGVIMAGEMVTVLGRAENNSWIYVEDEAGSTGFVFADMLTWPGDISQLPIHTASSSVGVTAVPIVNGNLSLDIYQLEGTEDCGPGSAWSQEVYMRAQGVSGTFEYYWQDELVGTAVNDNITFTVTSGGGPVIGTGRVVVNGAEVSKQIFIPAPSCSDS